jgi:hypothetical protein
MPKSFVVEFVPDAFDATVAAVSREHDRAAARYHRMRFRPAGTHPPESIQQARFHAELLAMALEALQAGLHDSNPAA